MSCIERCPHFRGKVIIFGTQQSVPYTEQSLSQECPLRGLPLHFIKPLSLSSQGVPEVIVGDPHTHAVEILWITSAACKTDSGVAPKDESKCYLIQSYEDPAAGLQAKFIDLSNLIRPGGHNASYVEMEKAEFRVSVCRPLQGGDVPEQCVGAMMCLTQTDPNLHVSSVTPLGYRNGEQSNLHIEDDLPTIVYTMNQTECEDTHKRVVKIHFMCPSGNEVGIVYVADQT